MLPLMRFYRLSSGWLQGGAAFKPLNIIYYGMACCSTYSYWNLCCVTNSYNLADCTMRDASKREESGSYDGCH